MEHRSGRPNRLHTGVLHPVFWKRDSSILTTAVKDASALFYERVLTVFFMNQARDSKRLKRGVGSKLYGKDVLVQIFIAKLTVWIVLLTELDKVGHLLVNSLEFRR